MKKNLLIIVGIILLTGCAKKTHQLDSAKITKQLKSALDSTGQRKIITVDKGVTTIEKQLDTAITVTGNSVLGYIALKNIKDSTIYAHFENEHIRLDLLANNGIVKATATSKPRKIYLKFNDKTIVANNINTTTVESSKLKANSDIKIDSLIKHEVNHIDPTVSVNALSSIGKWVFLIIIVLGILLYFGRKFIPV